MADKDKSAVDLETRISAILDGTKGFGNTAKLRKLGRVEYKKALEGKLAEKIVRQNADPRRIKRQSRKDG